MAGKPGIRNLNGMLGRRKGGKTAAEPPPPPPAGTLQDLIPRFLEKLEARSYSPATIDMHRWALRQFLGWCETKNLALPGTITRPDLEAYQLFLFHYRSPRTGRPLAVNTQLARLGCIRRFFARLCRDALIPANPASDLDLPRKQPRQLPKALEPDEIDRLMDRPDLSSPFGLRNRAILELFYTTGIRRSEMTALDLGDYDPHAQTLHIRRGKGGISRILPVGERAAHWLDRFLMAQIPRESALFLSGYATRITPSYLGNWVSRQLKAAGITKTGSCHLLRHSCATHMHRNGADIRIVQEMLGHARLETTQIYTHLNIRDLQDAHRRCHPHAVLPPAIDPSLPPTEAADSQPMVMPADAPKPRPPRPRRSQARTTISTAGPRPFPRSHANRSTRHLPPTRCLPEL
jgi:integrase/recombinase XerD